MLLQIRQVINNQFQCSCGRSLKLMRRHTRYCRTFASFVADPKEWIISIVLTLRSQTAFILQVTPPAIRIFRAQAFTARFEDCAVMHLNFVHFIFRHRIQMFFSLVKMHVSVHGRTFVNWNVGVFDGGCLRFDNNFFQVATFGADKDNGEAACSGGGDSC